MNKQLKTKEYVYLSSMLFGLFFGAGNLIFPGLMGQMAGSKVGAATLGFVITACGLPLLGIAAIGLSRSEGLFELGCKVSRKYSMFFTVLLYLTIGPFFAIPRTATVSYSVGIVPIAGDSHTAILIFSLAFFAVAMWFSLRPSKILTWVGKVLNPIFLVFLAILLVAAFMHPMGHISDAAPVGKYAANSFFSGFLEGYNTMDALASLAFGIIVIDAVRNLGVNDPKEVAKSTVFAGIFSALAMAVIYFALATAGAQSRGGFEVFPDGGMFLNRLSDHYLGSVGAAVMAITITVACLKTSIGLITACSTTFGEIFPNKMSYNKWVVLFTLVSFGFANFGLGNIIAYSIPVLMFLYPLTIVIILLSIFGSSFGYDRRVYSWTLGFTMVPAIFDGLKTLPAAAVSALHLSGVNAFAASVLPLSLIHI